MLQVRLVLSMDGKATMVPDQTKVISDRKCPQIEQNVVVWAKV